MNIRSLTDLGFYEEIIEMWEKEGFEDLLPIQIEAINKGLFDKENLLVVAPTSSGKTFIGEMAAIQYSCSNKRSIYLVPFKAVSDEKYQEFYHKYHELGFKICVSDGDHRMDDEDIRIGNYHIAILTYEKLSGMMVSNPKILNNCECVIVDEVQMMSDPNRGGNLELLLTKIKECDSKTQIIALSAVLGSLNGFDKWLNAEVIQVTQRPIELRQGILFTNGRFEYKEWNTSLINEEVINETELAGLIKHLIKNGEQVIIIKNSVPSTESLAVELSSAFSYLPAASKTIGELKDEPETEIRESLLKTLRSSVAFHNADCDINERTAIERGFKEGHVKILVSTTTLSMGVNLPCKTVILADQQKWDATSGSPQLVNWSVGEVRNIFGRAGRLGKASDFGRGIFLAKNSREREFIKRTYLNAPLENFTSAFENKDISLRLLDIVASGYGNSQEEIVDFVFKTFAALSWKTDTAKAQITAYINRGIDKCLTYGLFEQTYKGDISITDLGRICASMGCSLDSFADLVEYVQKMDNLNTLDLIYVVSKTKEVNEKFYRIKWENSELRIKILSRLADEYSIGSMTGVYLSDYEKLNGNSLNKTSLISFSIVLLLKDILLSNNSLSLIRKGYNFPTASIRNITLCVSWMIDVVYQILGVVKPQFASEVDKINNCISSRSTISSYFLNSVSRHLTREEKIRIVEKGIESLDYFLEEDSSCFKGILNPTKVDKIKAEINTKRERNALFWETDHIRRVEKLGLETSVIKNLYSSLGIDFEHELCSIFDKKFIECVVQRISEQKNGEPDLLMFLNSGEKYAIQVTAKENKRNFVEFRKSAEVITQSAQFNPTGYICIGKPDFQDLAIERAGDLEKLHDFKLIPLYILVELFVRVKEERITTLEATRFLRNNTGYLDIPRLNRFFQ